MQAKLFDDGRRLGQSFGALWLSCELDVIIRNSPKTCTALVKEQATTEVSHVVHEGGRESQP
jgi:hypothetical protein